MKRIRVKCEATKSHQSPMALRLASCVMRDSLQSWSWIRCRRAQEVVRDKRQDLRQRLRAEA